MKSGLLLLISLNLSGYTIPEWSITIVPKMEKGKKISIREQIKDGVAYLPYVDAEQFAKNLNGAYRRAIIFVETKKYMKQKEVVAFTDHEIREIDLKNLINFTMMGLKKERVQFYRTEDRMSYPRYTVVWQRKGFFKALRINNNNDNDAIAFVMMQGDFKKSRYFDQRTKKITRKELMKGIAFIKENKTIYPHIETYYICPSECDPNATK